jgi:glycosyltransferase involved in cell wall biosynthesis/tetratricopeptide (TPR) repeat protein
MNREETKSQFLYFPESALPAPPDAIPSSAWLAATAKSLAGVLRGIGPFYTHFGGAGDALLLLSTFLDRHPDAQVVSFSNSIPAARSFFEAFPSLRCVRFLPKNEDKHIHLLLRMLMRHVPNCRGMGVTPEKDYFKEWNSQLDIFKKFGVCRRPDWARRFCKEPQPKQIVLAPKGSLCGMLGSKRNIIHPAVWPELLHFIRDSGFQAVIIGTPEERETYPCLEGCEDRRSYSFSEQMTHIANSAALVGADSWAKTFAALVGIPTIVFDPIKGADWIGRKDPTDYVFIEPWDTITVVKNIEQCRDVFGGIFKITPAPARKTSPHKVSWIGSFLDHGSLSHVNREFARALKSFPDIQLHCVSNGGAVASGFEDQAREISATPPEAAVTVRHAWPPDWRRPARGKLVVIQPWEYGVLPEQWVKDSARVDEFWVPSEYVRRVYVESGVPADKVVIVPNGVDLEKINPQSAPMKLASQKKFKFLFVGGTIFRKGPDLLLQAYLDNFTAADDVCLVIKDFGGKSVYAGQTFESQIRAAQSQPNAPEILYLNEELPPDALPGLYTACDCLVLPYRGEGFGLPVIEAMASGLPVIVTAGGATDDFVRDEFAWRIPAQPWVIGHEVGGLKLAGAGWVLQPDVIALGRFLREAFGNPAETRRRGQAAAERARQFYSWKNSAAIAAERIRDLDRTSLPAGQHAPSTVPAAKSAPIKEAKIALPPVALVGHLAEARELVRQKKYRDAWESALSAIARRPFHPEACLLLAEIAQAAGDGPSAKRCADRARSMAPGWKPAKKFLNQRLKGAARPVWLQVPRAIQDPKRAIPTLTVCMIVKNEEKFLGQCLQSVHGVASQIVVVDTGSTDRTIEIAKEHGAEIHAFAWRDDFSAARNAALEHATGDWVLSIDADEELLPEHKETLGRELQAASAMAYRLPIIDKGRETEGRSYVPRLFRNAPGLFFLGRVHEQVFTSVQVRCQQWGLENLLGKTVLLHHGYTAGVVADRKKVERNLRLLESAVEELPGNPSLLMSLGLELIKSGRREEGLRRYVEALDCEAAQPAGQVIPEFRETLLTQFTGHLVADKRFDDIVHLWQSPVAKAAPMTASQHFNLGLAYMNLNQPHHAAWHMRECLAKRGLPALSPINPEILRAGPAHCLALCLAALKQPEAAASSFRAAIEADPKARSPRLDFARFLRENGKSIEALKWLKELVSEDAADLEVWRLGGQIALSKAEFREFACIWTGEAVNHFGEEPGILLQRAEALFLNQRADLALPIWRHPRLPKQPRCDAARVLCEVLQDDLQFEFSTAEEPSLSQEALKWYRRLIAVGASGVVYQLHQRIETLRLRLPGFVSIWETATRKAAAAAAATVIERDPVCSN